jgi:hypothetical protein
MAERRAEGTGQASANPFNARGSWVQIPPAGLISCNFVTIVDHRGNQRNLHDALKSRTVSDRPTCASSSGHPLPAACWGSIPREGKSRAARSCNPDPASGCSLILGEFMGILETLALICIVLGVILLILSVFGVLGGLAYGNHGAVTLIVIGIVLYVVLLLVPHTVM